MSTVCKVFPFRPGDADDDHDDDDDDDDDDLFCSDLGHSWTGAVPQRHTRLLPRRPR